MSAASDYRAESCANWERVAPSWERRNDEQWRASEPVTRDLVERLQLRPGETVLELAGGVGQTGLLAAGAVGPAGRVIATDFSPAMVDAARRLSSERGVENVEHRVMDAEAIDLPDASVDAVLCRFGLMLVADPRQALAQTRRVLRPGGRLGFAVWAEPEANPWTAIAGRTLVAHGAFPPPEPGAPGMFSLARVGLLEELVKGAGFEEMTIADVPLAFEYESFADYWSTMLDLGRALSVAVASLPPTEQEAVRAEVERSAEPYRTDGGYRLPGLSRNVVAS